MITNQEIDHGRGFDWGLASADYAKYRDIYPDEFYRRIAELGYCVSKARKSSIWGQEPVCCRAT